MSRSRQSGNGKRSVCITGGTGLLGKGIAETVPGEIQLVGVHQRDYPVEDPGAVYLRVDVRDRRAVDDLFAVYDFDTVVHAAGISSVDYAEAHYAEVLESNLTGTRNIALACRDAGCHLVYISTNAVFDGQTPPYRETDRLHPVNRYGTIKAECEALMGELLSRFTILRPILMYGWNHSVCRQNPATWVLGKLMRGEVIHMVNDVYENPVYNRQCGKAVWEVIRSKPSGIIHVAGGEVLNRYEFALKVARVFDQDPELIVSVDSSFFPAIARRPKNTSFVTERMRDELGLKPLDVESGLRDMKYHMRIQA